ASPSTTGSRCRGADRWTPRQVAAPSIDPCPHSATLPGKRGGAREAMRADGKTARSIALIKTAMIEKKMTQAELADAAHCHEKTTQTLLSGRPLRDQPLFDVCMVLGLDFDKAKGGLLREGRDAPEPASAEAKVAPAYMGAYTRAGVDHYIGSYLTLR